MTGKNLHQDAHHGHDVKKTVLGKIESGEVRMHSQVYFVVRVLFLIAVVLFTLIISALLVSFIIFSIRESGRWFLLGYGTRGVLTFFILFPWLLLLLDLLLLILLEWLLKHFRFAYKKPLLYLFIGGVFLSLIGGFSIDASALHRNFLRETQAKRLPMLVPIYEHARRPSPGHDVFRGVITSIAGNNLTVQADDHDQDNDDGVRKVIVPPDLLPGETFKVGDEVFVAGNEMDGQIRSYGLTKMVSPDGD